MCIWISWNQFPHYLLENMLISLKFCCIKCITMLELIQVHFTHWKFRNFTATVFSQKICQINVLLKNFTINCFDGKKFAWQWIFRFSTLCCGNYGNSLSCISISYFFDKKFVKPTILLTITQCGKTKNSLPRKSFSVKSIYSKVL